MNDTLGPAILALFSLLGAALILFSIMHFVIGPLAAALGVLGG
jgi:hypothetical protein